MSQYAFTTRPLLIYTVATRKNSTPVNKKHARRSSTGPCASPIASPQPGNMPYDSPKPNNTNNAARPLMPTLASNRTVRSPLTPRLAGQQQSAQSITPATGTPLSKRSARSELGSAKSQSTSKEALSTPVKAFITSNVTPRSSSRKSRVDSAQSTPTGSNNGTPTNSKFVSGTDDGPTQGFYTPGNASQSQQNFNTGIMTGASVPKRPKSTVSGVGGTHGYTMAKGPATRAGPMSPAREDSPRFFHADDAKSQTSIPERPVLKKSHSFFYASGPKDSGSMRSASKSPPPVMPSPALSSVSNSRSQFFRADGTIETSMQDELPLPSPPFASSFADMQPLVNPATSAPNLRPPSPSKENIHLSYRKGASQVIRPNSILSMSNGPESSRPSSTEIFNPHPTHARNSSLSSIDSGSRSSSRRPSLAAGPTSQPQLSVITRARKVSAPLSSPPVGTPLSIDPTLNASTSQSSTPLSPTKAVAQAANQLSELAANARRERKVMDLEISNSSLLAINRQLEREVRRQKAELRRYRRLTRAGRLSVATGLSVDAVDVADEEAYFDSDGEEQLGPGFLSDEDEDSEESDESALSASALAEHDSRRIAKDEKRLRLDLSKHRQLLVDSQKMNQSLRRCLGWTEELINEGKKALMYNVRVSDVKLSGRVLRRDEELEEEAMRFEESHGGEEEHETAEGDEVHNEAQDVGDVMGLMSPWMTLGSSQRSRDESSSGIGDGDGDIGLGIDSFPGAGAETLTPEHSLPIGTAL